MLGSERLVLSYRVRELLLCPQGGLEVAPDGVEGQGKVLAGAGLERTVISAGCVEVEEEVFEDFGALALSLQVFGQLKALDGDGVHDVVLNPIWGLELVFEGVVGFEHEVIILGETRPSREAGGEGSRRVSTEVMPIQPNLREKR